MRGWCGVRDGGVDRWQELRFDLWASLSLHRAHCRGWLLGPPWAGHSSCRRKGLVRSMRIRAESSQGAAQEVRMKAMAPRTPS